MKTIYQSEVTEIGSMVEEMLDANMFVLFCDLAPDDLRTISICHKHDKPPRLRMRPGDFICIGEHRMEILAVGEVAHKTFRELGHFCGKIRDRNDLCEMMLGDVLVACEGRPRFAAGMSIRIIRES